MRYTGPITIGDDKTITVIARSHGSTVDFLSQRYTINQSLSGELLHHWTSKNPGQPHSWTATNFNTPLMVSGKNWTLWGTAPTEADRLPYFNSSGLFVFGGRLLIGVDSSETATSSTIYDDTGEFQLAGSGLLRFTVNYTNQGYGTGQQTNPLALSINNNTNNAANSVHGSTLGSRVNTGEPTDIPTTFVWEINLRDLRSTQASEEALQTSFFQIFGGNGPTLIDSFFIEYKAPPVLTGITISGDDTVQTSTSEVTRQITLNAIQSPLGADTDIVWSIGSSSTFTENTTVAGVASINSATGVLTGIGLGEVWVFAKGLNTAVYASHKVTVVPYARINVTGITINSVPADAVSLMAGDGTTSNPGRTMTFTAAPIPANADGAPFAWSWNLRTSDNPTSSMIPSSVASLSGTAIRTLTAGFVEEDTDIWVHVSFTDVDNGINVNASRKITILKFVEADWDLIWSWDRDSIQSTTTIASTAAVTISGTHWRLFNAGGTDGTVLRPESAAPVGSPDSYGLVMGNNQRLLIGTNSNAGTNSTATGFHAGGQFNLGTIGTVRIRVHGTRTYNFFVAINLANSAANPDSGATVHGDRANFERQSPGSATSGMLVDFEINLATLADVSAHSAAALANTFITLRTQNAQAYATTPSPAIIHSIVIERAP
jgi:hypothetical protein